MKHIIYSIASNMSFITLAKLVSLEHNAKIANKQVKSYKHELNRSIHKAPKIKVYPVANNNLSAKLACISIKARLHLNMYKGQLARFH